MTHDFKVGDVVQLRGQRQPMTVEVAGEDMIKTVWFGYESQLYRGEFKPGVLEHDDALPEPTPATKPRNSHLRPVLK